MKILNPRVGNNIAYGHFCRAFLFTRNQPQDNEVGKKVQNCYTLSSQVKSSHLYLYSAFNNTNCNKALHNIKIGKFVNNVKWQDFFALCEQSQYILVQSDNIN